MILFNEAYIYFGILALVILCVLFLRSAYLKRKALSLFASRNLLQTLCNNYSKTAAIVKNIFILIGVGLLFFALARPQWGYEWQESKSKGIDIVFALDCSKSMNAADIKPDRLNRAKLAIEDVISNLDGDRIGLVAFSGQAFLQCPITSDYDSFRMSLEAVDTDLIQRGGTNISAAIDESHSAFGDSTNHKIVVIFSDGEDLEANSIARAKKAFSENVNIYTIGVGLSEGHVIPIRNARGQIENLKDAQGNLVKSKLDEAKLMQISSETGAFYSSLVSDGVDKLIGALKQIPKQELEAKMRRQSIDRFQIFLGVALVLLALESLISTRKFFVRRIKSVSVEKIVPMILFFLIVALPKENHAQNSGEISAKDFFNKAVENFEEEKFSDASELYLKAIKASDDLKMHSKAFHNLGYIDYQNAKSANEKLQTQNEIFDNLNQAKSVVDELMPQGKELLKDGLMRLHNDKENKTTTLEDEEFQNLLKQSISQCEELKKQSEEILKNKNSYMSDLSAVKNSLEKSVKNFESAVDLDKENVSSANNKNVIKKIFENAQAQEIFANDTFTNFEDAKKNLEALIEELKKLVRDEDNQNKDNQDQQNQQDKQDKQDKQDNSEQNKSEQEQSQNNQEEKENQSPEEKNEDENSAKQEQEKSQEANQESQPENPNEQNGEDVNKEELADAPEEKEEAPAPSSEPTAGQEQPAEQAENPAQTASQDFRKEEGSMTLREAMQLMDSEKENEKKLPFKGYGTRPEKTRDFKDW